MIRALVVGAGAVGQVYGAHLQRAGVHVSVFVKPKHAEEARQGFTLHRLRLFRAPETHRFSPDAVLTEMAQVASTRWDLVFLCVPTTALEGDYFGPLMRGVGGATVVSFQPGMHARELVARVVPSSHLVTGTIAFLAYRTPLGDDGLSPGTAYLFPPFASTQLSGERPRAEAIAELLRRGGCPARVHDDAERALLFSSAVMMPLVATLQAAGWSFDEVARGEHLDRGARAVREAAAIASKKLGVPAPRSLALVRPALLRLALALVPRVLPFDFEGYLRAHFTKVDDQSRLLLADLLEHAASSGLEARALGELYEAVYSGAEAVAPEIERRLRIRKEIEDSIESLEIEETADGAQTFRGVARFGPSLVGPPGRLHGGLHAYARLFRPLAAMPAHDPASTFPCRATLSLGRAIYLEEPVPFEGRYTRDAEGYRLEIRHGEGDRLVGTLRSTAIEGDPLAPFRDPYARARTRPPLAEVQAQYDQQARIDEELVLLRVDPAARRELRSVSQVVAPDNSVDAMFHCVQLDVVGAVVAGWQLQGHCYTVALDLTIVRERAEPDADLVVMGHRTTRPDPDSPFRPVEVRGELVGPIVVDVALADAALETLYAFGTVTMLPVRA